MTLALALGAALLAVWVDARFPGLRPKTATHVLIHAAIGGFGVLGAAGLVAFVYGIPDLAFMAVILGVFLPTLVYALLTGLWMLRALADMTFARR